MAIDFSRKLYQAPKVDFIGEDVPVEAFIKSSDILNQRYAQSAEAATKSQEALNQAIQLASPYERESLKPYLEDVNKQLQAIATDDDYINQEWKTKSLALRTSANLKAVEERKKQAEEFLDKLSLTKDISDPNIRKMYENQYLKQFEGTKYDPQTGLIEFSKLQAPKIVTDVNAAELLNKGLTGMVANKYGKSVNDVAIVAPGSKIPGSSQVNVAPTPLVYDLKTKSVIEKLTEAEVRAAGRSLLDASPEVQAVLQRDASYYKSQNPELNDVQALELAKQKLINPALKFAELKFGFTSDISDQNIDVNNTLTDVFSKVYGTPPPTNTNFWIGHTNDIDVTEPIKAITQEKNEIASQAFNKDGSFKSFISKGALQGKELDQAILNLMKQDPVKYPTYKSAFQELNQTGSVNSINDLVPAWKQSIFKANNPKITQKEMYENFMNEKIDYKKKMTTFYTLSDAATRKALNTSLSDFASMYPLYDKKGNEVTDIEQKQKILKQQAAFVPVTGQVVFGNDHISGLGVMNVNAPQTSHTQKAMAAASKMIEAALNPEVYNATTRDMFGNEGIPMNINGVPTPVNFRVMKTNVGKKVVGENQRLIVPSNIQMVGPNGQVIGSFRVDDSVEGQQGMNNFVNFMLNNAALKYTL